MKHTSNMHGSDTKGPTFPQQLLKIKEYLILKLFLSANLF